MDVDRTEGWFSKDSMEMVEKYGGRWATTSFEAGDMIFFGMFTMHGSTVNMSNRMRISCDTRYQLKDEPIDDRWVGQKMKGHNPDPNPKSMKEARKEWGLD